MSGEKRRDARIWGTAALLLATVALLIVHYKGRMDAMARARDKVGVIHKAAANAVEKKLIEFKKSLDAWDPESKEFPPEFDLVLKGDGQPDPVLQPVVLPEEVGSKEILHTFWVHTFSSETSQKREELEKVVRGDAEYRHALSFTGEGVADLEVKARLLDPPAPGSLPVNLEVLADRRTGRPLEPLGTKPLKVSDAAEFSTLPYKVDVAGEGRCDLVFRIPPDAPPVVISWTATLGKTVGAQLVVGVLKQRPSRDVDLFAPEEGRPRTVRMEPETIFVRGYVPMQRIAAALRQTGLETEEWGDRLYLTDASGTVVDAIPSFPEKIRRRAMDARRSLSSTATQRIKVHNGGAATYEGFAKDLVVVGAFAPVDAFNGGIIVEREEKRVLESYRGVQWWHLTALLFGVLILIPLGKPVLRKIREDTELPRLLVHAKPFVPHIVAIVITASLYAAGAGIMGYQAKVVTDEVLVSEEGDAYVRLRAICWTLGFVSVGMFATNWIKEYLGKLIQNRLIVEIRCSLCEKIAHLPMSFHSRQRAGDLLSRIQNDVSETNRGLEMLFGDIISDPIIIVSCITTAFVINWRLALVVFVGMPVILVPISYFGRTIKKYARRRQAKKADVTHTINQMLSGIRVVKAFRMEDHEARRIRSVSETFLVEAMKVARAQVTGKEFLEFFSNLSTIAITGIGGYLVLERQVSLGDVVAFGAVIARMYRSSKSLTSNYNKMQESLAGTERIFEIIDTPDNMADRPGARALVRPRQEIAFENVSFRYLDDGPWVVRDLSFTVPVGTSVALVGATGAGKSTILDLVARFYDPQKGRITIDGMDLRNFSRDSLLAQIAVVTQEPFLFNASIAENLLYGKPGAERTEVEAAARAASIHDEILKQEFGYDTIVGERGGRLSGGQRQRVTIARAILKDPPILLLDEATSALDSRVEQKVQEALFHLMHDRTTFAIAHRLSTTRSFDRILFLDGGTVVEQGSHDELMRIPNGHYRHLYEIQFASGAAPEGPASRVEAG